MKTRTFAALMSVTALFCLSALSGEIHSAAYQDDVAALERLLTANVQLLDQGDTNGATALHYAARSGKIAATHFLLKAGANMEAENSDKHTPLFCALHNGEAGTSKLLLDRGAKVTGIDKYGANALSQALRGAKDLVPLLVEKGANINHRHGERGFTLLHAAVAGNQPELPTLELLVRAGVDLHAVDSNGDTALHTAGAKGHLEVAKLLIEKGADPNKKNLLGFRPLDLVRGKENDALAAFLQERTISRGHEKGPALLGQLGDTALLVFEGNSAFTDEQLRGGLQASASYLLASHPQAQLRSFLSTLEHKIMTGYLGAGFPEPTVAASYDETKDRVRVKIAEGKRVNAGKVTVSGVPGKLQKEIRNRLTKPMDPSQNPFVYTPAVNPTSGEMDRGGTIVIQTGVLDNQSQAVSTPAWEMGEPAGFDRTTGSSVEGVIKTCLAEEGFLFPKVTVDRQTDPKSKTAELVVRVQPGPPGTIVEINVNGNKRDSRAEILNYVGLKSGMRVSRGLFENVERRLWDSARYMEWRIESEPVLAMEGTPGGVRLSLNVREHDVAPRLSEPLREDQKVLVRCAKWIQETTDDMVLEVKGTNISGQVVLSREDGILIKAALPGNWGSYAGVLSRDLLAIYPGGRGYKLEAKQTTGMPTAYFGLAPSAPDSTTKWNMSMGAGFRSWLGKTTPGGGFQLRISIPPAAMLNPPEQPGHIEKGVFTFSKSNTVVRIHAKTGRILDLTGSLDDVELKLRYSKGFFKVARSQLEREGDSMTNRLGRGADLGALAMFTLTELTRAKLLITATNVSPAQREMAIAATEKLLGNAILLSPGALNVASPKQAFHVPLDDIDMALARNNIATMFSGLVFKYSDQVFPKYSWPWTLARESVFLLGGQGTYADAELKRLYESEDTGPIGSLVIAQLLAKMNSSSARTFAIRGLTHLTASDFNADCKLLLSGDSGVARTFAAIAANLRGLSDAEIEGLALSLAPAEATLVRECSEALKLRPSEAMLPVLRPALERYWQDCLRAKVRSGLQKIALPPLKDPSQT